MYRLRGFEIPEAGRTAKGTAIVNLLNLESGEKISAIIPLQNFASDKYLIELRSFGENLGLLFQITDDILPPVPIPGTGNMNTRRNLYENSY